MTHAGHAAVACRGDDAIRAEPGHGRARRCELGARAGSVWNAASERCA
jgi:hypothetical protein